MTRISHMTNQQLADELGYIKAEKADIARREQAIKALLMSRTDGGNQTFEGNLFKVLLRHTSRATVDIKKVRQMFKSTGGVLPMQFGASTSWTVKARTEENAV